MYFSSNSLSLAQKCRSVTEQAEKCDGQFVCCDTEAREDRLDLVGGIFEFGRALCYGYKCAKIRRMMDRPPSNMNGSLRENRTNRSRAQDGSDHDDQHCSIDEVFTHQNMFAWTVLYSKLQATMKLL